METEQTDENDAVLTDPSGTPYPEAVQSFARDISVEFGALYTDMDDWSDFYVAALESVVASHRAPLDSQVERGVVCFHGTPRACEAIRCGSNCDSRFDRMHPCPACLIANIHDLRLAPTVAGVDPYSVPRYSPGGEQ